MTQQLQFQLFLAHQFTKPEIGPSLAAFATNRFNSPSNISRGRSFLLRKRPFCRTCYDGNRGKYTYLSHLTTDPYYPCKIQLNRIETYLPEVRYRRSHHTGHLHSRATGCTHILQCAGKNISSQS